MAGRWTSCSRRCGAAGLTLIEVVAAIAILGTVLVGIVLAQSRHTRQIARAAQVDAAMEAADRQLEDWWASGGGVPIDDRGEVEGAPLRWISRVVPNQALERLDARVVRVEFYETGALAGNAGDRGAAADKPLLMIDLVLPRPKDPAASEGEGPGEVGRRGGRARPADGEAAAAEQTFAGTHADTAGGRT